MSLPLRLSESAYAHYLPYWWVGEGAMVMHDGTLARGFRLTGVDIGSQPDEHVNAVAHHLRHLLNTLPVGFQLQILRRSTQAPQSLFDTFLAAGKSAHPILSELRRRNAQHLAHSGLKTFESFLLLSKPFALGRLHGQTNGWLSVFERALGAKSPKSITRVQHDTACAELAHHADGLSRHLAPAGVNLAPLGDQELVDLAFTFLNPGFGQHAPRLSDALPTEVEAGRIHRALSLREQLVTSSLNWDVDSLTLDDPIRLHRVMGLKALPSRTLASLIHGAAKLSFGHWLAVGVSAPDSERKFGEVEKRRNRAKVAASGFVRDVKASTQADELESVLDAMVRRDQRVFQLSLSLLFDGSSLSELDARTREAREVFRRMAGCVLHTESMAQLPAFLGMLPGNAHRAPRRRTLLTDNAADVLPVYGSWLGDKRPLCVLPTLGQEPFVLDIDDPTADTWNSLVFGGSGGGKTFLVLSLATSSMLGRGAPLIVVDVGGGELGSYYRLCRLLGGDFVDLNLDGRHCINPFVARADLFRDDQGRPRSTPDGTKLGFLIAIAKLLVTDPGAPELGRVESSILQRGILAAYARLGDARPPIFSDVASELAALSGEKADRAIAQRFAKNLRAVLEGPAGKLINQQSRVSLNSSFIVFDLKGLEAIGDMGTVMLLIVSAYVWNMLGRLRAERAWLIYDETWKLLKNRIAAEVQEELYRTIRKLKGGIISITQDIADLLAVPSANAILKNSDTTFFLRHKEGRDAVAKLVGMNERERALFDGLSNEKGVFSDVLVRKKGGSAVLRYRPSAFDYWVNTTDGRDRQLEAQVLKEVGGDRLAALRRLARDFPHGAAHAAWEAPHAHAA